jgi:uncharacterized protein YraI
MTRTAFPHAHLTAFALAILLAAPVSAAAAAAGLTARASGVQAVHAGPGAGYPIVDKLANNERVRLDVCKRQQTWCHVVQLDGGPSGWVPGAWLVGSPAKNAVTPYEFGFDPLDPLDLFQRR